MESEIKLFFQNMIKRNYVLTIEDDSAVAYVFNDKQTGNKVKFLCEHAYNTPNQIFARYSIFIGSVPYVSYTLPTSNKPKHDILQLVEMCANKVIQQQQHVKRNMFLRIHTQENTIS